MSAGPIRFDDADAYERFMGQWSHLAGSVFLDWLAPPGGLRWADVGCGNGAFTELLFNRAAAAHVAGVDPSPGQLTYARTRLQGRSTDLQVGTAESLPFPDAGFDAAAMALVIFFVPVPADGVAEMARVVRSGGIVAAYAWDIPGGGFPTEPVAQDLRAFGIDPPRPPRADVSTAAALEGLWTGAGLQNVRSRTIEVEREFPSFDEWWSSIRGALSLARTLDQLTGPDLAALQDAVRNRLRPDAQGRIRCRARANAIAGTTPR